MNNIKEIKKEFEDKFDLNFEYTNTRDRVWDWIESKITQREREAYKEIKAKLHILHDKKQSQLHGGYDDADFLNAYCMALSDAEDAIDTLSQTKGDSK